MCECLCVLICCVHACVDLFCVCMGVLFFLEVDGKFLKKSQWPFLFGIFLGIDFSTGSILGSLGEEPSSVILTLPPLFRDSLWCVLF